jgi:hypothetical protein
MSPQWIVATLYLGILVSLAVIVWWEYQRAKKSKTSSHPDESPR